MKSRGWNAPDLRKRNRAGILKLVHLNRDIARNDLAAELGLTRASVTILVNELIVEGLLEEAGTQASAGRVGRRKIALRVRPGAGRIIGVGIDPERVQVLLTDLAGSVLGTRDLPPPPALTGYGSDPADRITEAVAEAVGSLLGTASPRDAGLVWMGVGVTGRVDAESGVSIREPRLWNGPVELAGPLARRFGVPAAVDNNVRALALAELLLTEARGSEPAGLLFVKYGPGVGASWTAGGVPWAGAHNRSGELGHTVVASEGPTCPYCGRIGCLESLVSALALGQRLARPRAGTRELCQALLQSAPDEYARLAGWFALALGNAIELYDPTTVALYGAPFRDGPLFDEIARRVESNERPCEIKRSNLDPEFPALGGAALALERFFLAGGQRPQVPAG